jgi:hypothetical protein
MQAGGAGYTEWLIFHIWRPASATGRCCPNIALPETVICRWSRPFYWYFSSETGEILRKTKSKVSFDSVHKHFAKRAGRSGIVAQYLAFGDNKDMTATVEFLAKDGFTDFMEYRDKAMSSIIQQWVEPRHNHNSMIKAIWNPQFCLIERKRNLLPLDDPDVDFYDKLVTYEGMEHFSETQPVASPSLVANIQLSCLSISEHIRMLTGGNVLITSMTLYFKEDVEGKLWLMFCTNLKLYDIHKEPIKEMGEVKLTIPETARTKVFTRDLQYFELERNRVLCISCNALVRKTTTHSIQSRMILDCLQRGVEEPTQIGSSALSDSRTEGLPNILKRVNQADMSELRTNMRALELLTEVCENCFLHYSKHYFDRPEDIEPVLPRKPAVLMRRTTIDVPQKVVKKPDIERLYSPKLTSSRSLPKIARPGLLLPTRPSITSKRAPTTAEIYAGNTGRSTRASTKSHNTPSSTFRLR